MDVIAYIYDVEFNMIVTWQETHTCNAECIEGDCLQECPDDENGDDDNGDDNGDDGGEPPEPPDLRSYWSFQLTNEEAQGLWREGIAPCGSLGDGMWHNFRTGESGGCVSRTRAGAGECCLEGEIVDPPEAPGVPNQRTVTGTFWRAHTFDMRFIHVSHAGFTVATDANVSNPILYAAGGFVIPAQPQIVATHTWEGGLTDGHMQFNDVTFGHVDTSWPTPAMQGYEPPDDVELGVGTPNFNLGVMIDGMRIFNYGHIVWDYYEDCCWDPSRPFHCFDCDNIPQHNCRVSNPRWHSRVQAAWRAAVGNVFAQNSALEITLGNITYRYVVPGNNISQYALTMCAHTESDRCDDLDLDCFRPRMESWHSLTHVPVSGFTGHNLEGPQRNNWMLGPNAGSEWSANSGNRLWVQEHIDIVERLVNGNYTFESFSNDNFMLYGLNPIRPPGWFQGNHATTQWENMSHSPQEVVSPGPGGSLGDNQIDPLRSRFEYTSWQPAWGGMTRPTGSRSGYNLANPPMHYSINPVIIHNPTGNPFAWIHDVPQTILADQRIMLFGTEGAYGEIGDIIRHNYAMNYGSPGRLYIDFDFKVTIPNHATLYDYWHQSNPSRPIGPDLRNPTYDRTQTSSWSWGQSGFNINHNGSQSANWGAAGIVDIADTPPGWRGKGYEGPFMMRYHNRHENNPHNYNAAWDISKWINAKFIRFPFDVYFYGNVNPRIDLAGTNATHVWGGRAHPGGMDDGFYPAGTWILLYCNGWSIYGDDPTEFFFRVASHVLDTNVAVVDIVTENINARDLVQGMSIQQRGEFNFNNSENANNGRREHNWNMSHASPQSDLHDLHLAAQHATYLRQHVHVVGRIGNVVVDDLADPRWTNIFWDTVNGNPQTHIEAGTNRFITSYYNIYDTLQNRFNWPGRPRHPWTGQGAPPGGFISRYCTLTPWHDSHHTITDNVLYTLPVMRNPIPEYNQQVPLLGYEFQFSVQTIGDFDRPGASMIVMPRYHLIGNWENIPAGERWFMFASDPWDPTGHMRMFYDTNLIFGMPGYTRHMNYGLGQWNPDFDHQFWHSLANTRAKVNHRERPTPNFASAGVVRQSSYERAMQLGSQHQEFLGTPTFINIPQYLRTWHGSTQTKGRTGEGVDWLDVESSPQDYVGYDRSVHRNTSTWQNTHRWHGRSNLPRTTMVISESNLPYAQFEGRTTDQMIGTAFTFRTRSNNGIWDLTTFTNTGVEPFQTHPLPDYPGAWDDTPESFVPGIPPEFRRRPNWSREPWSWVRRPKTHQPPDGRPNTGPPNYGTDDPGIPIIIVDYSTPAQSDSVTIGTH